ncbi:hypothetical protein V8E55_002922, partial [Tylopilus felleus]
MSRSDPSGYRDDRLRQVLALIQVTTRRRQSVFLPSAQRVGQPWYVCTWTPSGSLFSSPTCVSTRASCSFISRSGRGIKFTELTQQIRTTYNFTPSFCSWVPHIAARMLGRNYKEDTFDLEELDLHNGIEHDASLTRLDTALQPKQWIKHDAFIQELLSFATGKDADGKALLTIHDTSRILGKRRAEAKATNKDYTLSLYHKIFGSTKYHHPGGVWDPGVGLGERRRAR